MSNNTGTTLLALLTGAAIGAGVGFYLLQTKDQNKRKIKDGYKDAQKISEKYEKLQMK
jgi:hypothetical protein